MTAPGTTGKCSRCGALVRWATLAATGARVAVEPTSEPRLLGFAAGEPYRNVQRVQALVPHECRRTA